MDFYGRQIDKALQDAPVLWQEAHPRIVLFGDCHRGCGTWNDGFLPNKTLYLAALGYYWEREFTYIELGDGDELWENRSYEEICRTHEDVFALLRRFQKAGRLYQLWGNHDRCKADPRFRQMCLRAAAGDERAGGEEACSVRLFPRFSEGLILRRPAMGDLCMIHGHQTDLLNDQLWKIARSLVRYLWRPLELAGIRDPTSAAKNYTRKGRAEARMMRWVQTRQTSLIAGHTHRPMLPPQAGPCYYNTGSCVHPNTITCLEVIQGQISLIKWVTCVDADRYLTVCRQILSGPKPL